VVGYVVNDDWNEISKAIEKRPIGTIFFLRLLDRGVHFEYGITCHHVVGPNRDGVILPVSIRLNRTDGTIQDIAAPYSEWVSSEASDIAVLPITLDASTYKRWSYPVEESIRSSRVRRPVPGDQVFLVGLFIEHPGADTRIQPLIRTGSVANEAAKVDIQRDLSVQDWVSSDAYLIESRSWGGREWIAGFCIS
jgi:hypothetical protein